MTTAKQLIESYSLQPHPEGGWYKEAYRSKEIIPVAGLPDRYNGNRCFSTFIYFLLEQGEFSAFHKIQSDECWHFYAGDPMQVFIIEEDGALTVIELGSDAAKGQLFHYVVQAGRWFASRPSPGSSFSFVGCTVAPGFEFSDFELADADKLAGEFPKHQAIIRELCI